MGLIVQKFGGSSVADGEKIRHVARIITDTYDKGNSVVAVVSAQGGTTDELIAKAAEINPNASPREMDMLLSTGEQASCALCAMAVEVLNYPVISLTGRQAGVHSDSVHGNARIQEVDPKRILSELAQNRIVIVAGFQGEAPTGDITTLGRGGSDTSAVALAAALNAELCQIYTDVDGVYTTDPRVVPQAVKLEAITYDEMLALAHYGAKVLHDRSVALAKEKQVTVEVLSSFSGNKGTILKDTLTDDTDRAVAGITQEKAAVLSLTLTENTQGLLTRISALLDEKGITADFTLQAKEQGGSIMLSLGVQEREADSLLQTLHAQQESIRFQDLTCASFMRVSIVGQDIDQKQDLVKRLELLLKNAQISVKGMTFGRHRISFFVPEDDCSRALSLLHVELFEAVEN